MDSRKWTGPAVFLLFLLFLAGLREAYRLGRSIPDSSPPAAADLARPEEPGRRERARNEAKLKEFLREGSEPEDTAALRVFLSVFTPNERRTVERGMRAGRAPMDICRAGGFEDKCRQASETCRADAKCSRELYGAADRRLHIKPPNP